MRNAIIVFLALAATACGGSSVTSADVQRYSSLALDVSSAATTYQAQAATMTGVAGCAADESSYDGQVRPMVEQMQQMGPMMDDFMGSSGHMAYGDMGCSGDAMMAELDRHRAAACASADVSVDQAEAQHHVSVMTEWAAHAQARAGEMASMMGGTMGGASGFPSMPACARDASGGYVLQ